MERLTKKNDSGGHYYPKCFEKCNGLGASSKCDDCEIMTSVCEKLGDYEDLDEQGRLVKLPCKVGDTVWVVTSPFNVFDDIEYDDDMKDEVYESYVSSVSFYECGEQYRIYAKATNHFIGAYFRECDFGKTVFLTKSEAEAKLKELRGGECEQ